MSVLLSGSGALPWTGGLLFRAEEDGGGHGCSANRQLGSEEASQ